MAKWKIVSIFILFILWGYCSIKFMMLFQINVSAKIESYLVVFIQCFIEMLSIFYVIKYLPIINRNMLSRLILIWLFYAAFVTLINTQSLFHSLRDLMWWPLIYVLCFIISIKVDSNKLNSLLVKFFIPTVIIVNVCIFVYLRSINFNNVMLGVEGFESSNQIFFIALLLPLCFLYKEYKYKYFFLLIILISIFISFKRSALIYGIISFAVALYFDFFRLKKINIILRLFLPAVLCVIFYFSFIYIEEFTGGHILGRIDSMQSDGGSGRLTIYERMIDYYMNESSIFQLFGIGFDNAKMVYLKYHSRLLSCHNDLLEMLVDFGLIGLSIYLIIIICLIKLVLKSKKLGDNYYQANIVAILCFIIMTMVSHLFIYPTYFAYLQILWGFTAGNIQKGLFLEKKLMKEGLYNGRFIAAPIKLD